jgi:hypothetical protein
MYSDRCSRFRWSQKPVKEERLWVTYVSPPPTVAAMIDESEAAVIAGYTGDARMDELVTEGGLRRRTTLHDLRILEIVKYHVDLPVVVEVMQVRLPRGDKNEATHTHRLRDSNARAFESKTRSLVFLKLNPQTNELQPARGPNGTEWSLRHLPRHAESSRRPSLTAGYLPRRLIRRIRR